MANEFVARNGLIAQDNSTISGSLTVTNGITGAITGTASYASNANLLDGLDSSVFTSTGSFNAYTSSNNATVTSVAASTALALASIATLTSRTGSYTLTSSFNSYTASNDATVSCVSSVATSALVGVAALAARTGSYATTGSNNFNGTQTITGSLLQSGNFTTTGTITAQTINVQQVTSSIVYSCGSNNFGTAIGNTQIMTGSVLMTGSLSVAGTIALDGTATSTPSNGGLARLSNGFTYFVGKSNGNGANLGNGDGTATIQALSPGGSNGYIVLETGAGTERLRIASTGISCFACQVCVPNIISTGASGGRYATFNAPTNGGYITFEAGGTAFGDLGSYCAQYGTGDATTLSLQSRTGYALALGTNSTERVRLDTSGNLMVGSVSAGNAGTINVSVGCAGTTAGGLQLWASTAQTHYVQFGDGTAGAGPYAGYIGYAHATDTLLLGAGAATRAIITSAGVACFSSTVCAPAAIFTGCVGIGITSPGVTLDVKFDSSSTDVTGSGASSLRLLNTCAANTNNFHTGIWFRLDNGINNKNGYIKLVNDATNAVGDFAFILTQSGTESERLRIKGNGWVGIGTSSPCSYASQTLHVNSPSGASTSIKVTNTTTTAGVACGLDILQSNSDTYIYNRSVGLIELGTSNAARLTISSAGIACFACQICVKETVYVSGTFPSVTLDRAGTTAQSDIKWRDAGTTVWSIGTAVRAVGSSLDFYSYCTGDNVFKLSQTGITCFSSTVCAPMVLASGCIGIGTTNPSFKLDICTAQSIRVIGSSTGYTQGSIILQSSTTDTPEARGLGVYAFNEGTDATWFYGTAYNAADSFAINRKAGTTYQDAAASVGEACNFLLINNVGNVGIRVTPSAWASSFKALQVGTATLSQNNTQTAYIGSNWVSESGGDKYITTAPAAVYSQNSGAHIWYQAPSGTAGCAISFTQAMTLNASGNLGINTTSPCAKLQVNSSGGDFAAEGTLLITRAANATGDGSEIRFQYGSTNRAYQTAIRSVVESYGGTDAASLQFLTQPTYNALATRMTITGGGNVGIGTTAPNAKLNIQDGFLNVGSSANVTTANTLLAGYGYILSGTTYGNVKITSTYSNVTNQAGLEFYTDNGTSTERMRITAGGQVQIGCGVNASFYNGPGCRYNFTALNTAQDLVGICANNGIIVFRDHTAGGTGVFLIDPNQGVICMASNIPATVSIAWNGSTWRWCLTSGGVPRCLGYGFYGA
jgi:hypothetical protein